MKKFILFAVILSLLVPTLALAAAEFSLGGFVKLDAFWDSTQQGKNMNTLIQRNNAAFVAAGGVAGPNGFNHGRMKFTAQGSRFNFTIKGPKLFGAQTTGFMEIDFDSAETGVAGVANNPSNSYTPRLRHAMFRFNWPDTELLFGQYWSMFCEWYPETAEDGPFQGTGAPTARIPQIRVSQKFLGAWTVAGLIGSANGTLNGQAYSAVDNSGQSSETPQIQGKVEYAQDLWGKAAYYGRPTPFTAKVTGGWQRSTYAQQSLDAFRTFGQNTWSQPLGNITAGRTWSKHQTLDPWLLMGSVFIPVLSTSSANLAGTASIVTQWWMGQGVEAFGFVGFGANPFKFNNSNAGSYVYDAQLMKRWGGYAQAQYYFTNQWFLNVAWGMSRAYNVEQDPLLFATQGPVNLRTAANDPTKWMNQIIGTLWYRPITSLKFGLQYQYCRTKFFQQNGVVVGLPEAVDAGENHRVMFAGFFYF